MKSAQHLKPECLLSLRKSLCVNLANMEPTRFSTAKILKVKNCTVSPCQPCSPVRQKHYWKNMAMTTKVTFQTQFSRAWYPKNQKGGGFTSHSNKSFFAMLPCTSSFNKISTFCPFFFAN